MASAAASRPGIGGCDPSAGRLHSARPGRAAIVLDVDATCGWIHATSGYWSYGMLDVIWAIVVVAVLVLVAVVLIADALLERSVWARAAASLALAAGLAQGAEIGDPWLPISLLLAALASYLVSRSRRRPTPGRPIADPERGRGAS